MSHFVTWPKALAVVTLFWVPLAALAEDGTNPCPSGTVTSGSSSVTVEGKQVARAGDTAGCAGTITEGSPDVFINSGDIIYADNPLVPSIPLPDGTVWRNLVTEAKSKVAETLDEYRGNYAYNLLDENARRFYKI